jgi:thiosulfate dehydrogenase [quinone] large subunit
MHRPGVVLLPLRLAFGAIFLYAGMDKILDPAFLQPAGRGSIAGDLAGYVQVSPIGPLVALVEPLAVPLGLAIALAEIAVGLGALLGLAFRAAALGGLALSTVFFLTASWQVRPFYLGNDLPYAIGWLTLLLAGHGGILVLDDVQELRRARPSGPPMDPAPPLMERRGLVRLAALGLLAVSVAGVSSLVEATLGRRVVAGPPGGPSPEPTVIAAEPSASPSPAGTPSAAPSATPSPVPSRSSSPGKLIARISDVTTSHPVVFQDPYTTDPGILLRLTDGRFVAYDAICTHAACTVEFDLSTGYLICPCHGAVFDPARDGKAIDGPTFYPLMAFPIEVDRASGTIRLTGV